ncbi:MAG: hypothetical protein ACREGA_03595 [Candidatus Saccharimonadales bacterium]
MATEIVLIGGTSGNGKSTAAREVAAKRQMAHRLGLGFVREVIRAETDEQAEPDLFKFSFEGEDPVHTLLTQAERLRPAVLACIRRAADEGTSLVIEGTHIIPRLYADTQKVTRATILAAPERQAHWQRFQGDAQHTARDISPQDFENIRRVNGFLLEDARAQGWPIIPSNIGRRAVEQLSSPAIKLKASASWLV